MEEIELPPTRIARHKLVQGILAHKNGAVSFGYVEDALNAFTADQVRQAVLQERERCAAVCEAEAEGHRMAFGEHCAVVIRAG